MTADVPAVIAGPLLPRQNSGCDDCSSVSSIVGPAHVGSASFSAALSSLVLAVLGAGQLTLPYAFSQLGLGFGLAALVSFSLLSVHSLRTLTIYELHFTPGPRDCIESYSELVVRVLGRAGSTICSILLALYAWGGAVSFMLILKEEIGSLAKLAGARGALVADLPFLLVACLFIFPLSSLQDLSGLKKFSPLGCVAAIFITFVVLLCTPWNGDEPAGAEVCAGPTGSHPLYQATLPQSRSLAWLPESFEAAAAALPLLSFALNSSWAYIPILCTMRGKTPGRVSGLIWGSNAIILANYLLISVYGYTMFCGTTAPNIIDSLGKAARPGNFQGTIVLLARVALAVQLSLALPMRFFVARKTMGGEQRIPVRVALAGLLVGSATAVASMPISLARALGITSSVCASMIIYILPAAVDLRLQLPGLFRKAVSVVSLLIGSFVLCAGLLANLLGAAAVGG